MAQTAITVSALNQYIKRMMEQDTLLYQLLVRGEISNFKHHSSGHMYFTLKDEQGAIKAVMFKGQNQHLKFRPTDGMKVLIRGRVSVFEREGVYQLYAEEIEPDGVGALHIAFEQLKKRLSAEGLFSPHRKKAIPMFPEKIGVVTSLTGAAIRDIIQVIQRRYPYGEILIFPVAVQGEGAAEEIAKAILLLNTHRACEVIIVGRGGGSIEDLWAFNEEAVALAIAQSKIPVISAVGHETDYTIADFVADLRAPTPSAAAELVATSMVEMRQLVEQLTQQLIYHMEKKVNVYRLGVKRQMLMLSSPRDRLLQNRLLLDNETTYLVQTMKDFLNQYREKLSKNSTKLHALNPVAVLARGYAIAKNERGEVVKSIDQIGADETISIQVSDGEIISKALQTEKFATEE